MLCAKKGQSKSTAMLFQHALCLPCPALPPRTAFVECLQALLSTSSLAALPM